MIGFILALHQSWQHKQCFVYTRLGSGKYQCNLMRSSLLVKSHYCPSVASTRNTILTWHNQTDWFYICRLFSQRITAFIPLNHEWQLPRTMFCKSKLYNRVKILRTISNLNSALVRRLRAIILSWTPCLWSKCLHIMLHFPLVNFCAVIQIIVTNVFL